MNAGFVVYFLLPIRNIFRHRLRSAATLSAIAIGVAGLILAGGFVQDVFVQLGETIIHSQTGHIQVTREGYREGKNRSPEQYFIGSPGELKAQLMAGQPAVKNVLARLGFTGMINNGKRDLGIMGEGIEPKAEADLGSYMHFIDGRPLEDKDADGIIVGQGVAKTLGLKVGDRVTLVMSLAQGAVNTLDFELVGIFQSFSKEFDAHAVRIPLEAARTLMDTHSAHVMVVTLHDTNDTVRVASAMRSALQGDGYHIETWQESSDFYDKTLQLYDRQFGILRLIVLLMVLLSVTNSINMTLFERTREFGTMAALGDPPGAIFRLIMSESFFLGIFGAALGVLAGCASAWIISEIGIPMPPPPNANLGYTAMIRLVPADIATAGGIGFIATCLAALFPAHRASRLSVVDALRHGF